MKKLIFTMSAVAMLAISGCKKEPCPQPQPDPGCHCGIVIQEGDSPCLWVELKNDCTGNVKRFCIPESDWVNAYPGRSVCIPNTKGW